MPNLSKKIVLVTGANKGIGLEVARQIGRTGAIVLLGARNKLAGEKAAALLAGEGLAAHFIAIDVTDRDSVSAAAAAIAEEFGRLDVLVNNAGISDPADGAAPTACLDAVERVLRTNFLGALASPRPCCRCCVRPRPHASSTSPAASAPWRRMAIPVTRPPTPS